MADLLYSYSKETVGIMNSFIKRNVMPSLPEILSDVPVPGSMRLQAKWEQHRAQYITISDSDKSHAYAIFYISRESDMVRRFQVTGELANNTNRILLVVGRQIIASSDDVKSPIGDSWFPACALPFQRFGVWCRLRDENGPKIGGVEYNSCILSRTDRHELTKLPCIYPVGYDIVLTEGNSLSSKIGEVYGESIITWLKNKHPFYDKHSLSCWPLAGKIIINEREGVFERLGQVFDRVVARANKSCEFLLKSNDLIIFRQFIDPDLDVQVIPGTSFVYPLYGDISFEFVPKDGNSGDLLCSVERSELLLNNSISDRPYLIPELELVLLKQEYYVTSKYYAQSLTDSSNDK